MKGTVAVLLCFIAGCAAGWSGIIDMDKFGDAWDDATMYILYLLIFTVGIGMGCNQWNSNSSSASIGNISISDSNVTASGGWGAAAIGFSYSDSIIGSGSYRAGKITITTGDEVGFLSKLTKGSGDGYGTAPQRIGKGAYTTTSSFKNTDGSGPWEGVVINDTKHENGVN